MLHLFPPYVVTSSLRSTTMRLGKALSGEKIFCLLAHLHLCLITWRPETLTSIGLTV